MTLFGRNDINQGLALGVVISLLLHSVLFAAAMKISTGSRLPEGSSPYTVRLVDLPGVFKQPPRVRGEMPEQPSALEVPEPNVPSQTQSPQQGDYKPEEGSSEARQLDRTTMFDQSAIEYTARQSADEELVRNSGGVTFNTRDMMYRGYMDMLRQKVETIWVYPQWAARQGIYGDLIIHFVILEDGRLGEVTVLRTSGHKVLDDAAVKALRDGIPYWPLPKGWEKKTLPITGRFIYSKGLGYIR